MTELSKEERTCPRCKGRGILLSKAKVFSPDPKKKWCSSCKQFLDRANDFYGLVSSPGYCKNCLRSKNRKSYDPEKRKIHENKCNTCGGKFLGRKNQLYCSRRCNCTIMNEKKELLGYRSLPNELRDQLKDPLDDIPIYFEDVFDIEDDMYD